MFKELNPLLHSELRLAVMSMLLSVEEAEFIIELSVFISEPEAPHATKPLIIIPHKIPIATFFIKILLSNFQFLIKWIFIIRLATYS